MRARVAPLRDEELVELLRDDAELLAIADAVASTAPRRRAAVRALVLATIACAAGVAVAPAFGVHFRGVAFWAAPAAPRSAQATFAADPLSSHGFPGLKVGETRSVAVEPFQGETMRLFVAPVRSGGFCYEWAIAANAADEWFDELGGCDIRNEPVAVSFDDTRLSIVADSKLIDRVVLKLSDGSVVEPAVHWVSAPVDAGFLLYQPPNHLGVIEVDGMYGDSLVSARALTNAPIRVTLR